MQHTFIFCLYYHHIFLFSSSWTSHMILFLFFIKTHRTFEENTVLLKRVETSIMRPATLSGRTRVSFWRKRKLTSTRSVVCHGNWKIRFSNHRRITLTNCIYRCVYVYYTYGTFRELEHSDSAKAFEDRDVWNWQATTNKMRIFPQTECCSAHITAPGKQQ